LAGVGPILGDGSVGSFVANDGNVSWFYQDGKTGTRNPAGLETVSLTLQEEPVLQTPSVAPVAVLVDNSTASSAEAITIAFHGRPASRSFGSRTAGKSTAVQPFKLDDGAELYLTTAIDADRSGKAYPDGFTPDQVISFNGGSMPLENNDQVLMAAQVWLVASTTTVAPQPPATLKTKLRRKKAGVPQKPRFYSSAGSHRGADPGKRSGGSCRSADPSKRSGGSCRSADPSNRSGGSCRSADPGKRSGGSCRSADPGKRSGRGCRSSNPDECFGSGARGGPNYYSAGSGCRSLLIHRQQSP